MDTSILTKQIGPLPVAGWAVGVGGGVAFLVLRNKRGASGGSAVTTEPSIDPYSQVGTGPGGWIATPPPPPPNVVVDTPMTTNQEWAAKASRELMARNYDPTLVDSMIRKAVGGLSMTPAEMVLFSMALKIVGPLPEVLPPAQEINPNVPPVTVQPPIPPAPPSTTTPAIRYHIVVKGETLWGISVRYYGTGLKWSTIYNANRNIISNPALIYPGQRLVIP